MFMPRMLTGLSIPVILLGCLSVNGRLAQTGRFRRIFALPMASDRGIGLGAALYHLHHQLGVERFFRKRPANYRSTLQFQVLGFQILR